jgi:hypothetical protein
MRHWINNATPDREAGNVPTDERDTRPIWLRVAMVFQGWCMF